MKATTTKPAADPLVGRCFLIWADDNKWRYQGIVKARISEQVYLVQFFEAFMGEPNTMMLANLSDMTGASLKQRASGAWEFFEDDKHLRDWCEQHPQR